MSRDPTHWIHATLVGCWWSEGLITWPLKGPDAERIRSNSMLETTLGYLPYPYMPLIVGSKGSKPGVSITEPTEMARVLSVSSCMIASASHALTHGMHSQQRPHSMHRLAL